MRTVLALGLILSAACAALALSACQGKDSAKSGAGDASPGAQASGGAITAGPISASDMPHRKPGLWKLTEVMDGVDRHMNMQTCIDADSDAKMAIWGNEMGKSMCQKNEITRGLDGSIHFAATCAMGAMGTSNTTGEASGDYSSHYTVKTETTTTGAAGTMAAANGHHAMVIDAQWVGPCAAGQKGGDIMMNGMTIHAADMAAAAAARKH